MARGNMFASIILCLVAGQECRGGQGPVLSSGFVSTNPETRKAGEEQGTVLARISYHSSYVSDAAGQKRSPGICFELYQSGHYRMTRMKMGGTESLGGNLSADELAQAKKMVGNLDFESTEGGLVQRGTESFIAEIVRRGESERYLWVNPDEHRPFPASAAKIIHWLQNFEARGARPLTNPELSTDPICPRASEKPLQPVR